MRLTAEMKVTLLTAACLLLIALLFKYVFHKYIDPLALLAPFYIYLIYRLTGGLSKKAASSPAAWNIIIVLLTFLVVLIYAIK